MKIFRLILLFLLISINSYGQSSDYDFDSYNIDHYLEPNSTYYIYSDVANVRNGAGIAYDKVDQLTAGDEVTFIENDSKNSYLTNGLIGGWLKIVYKKDNIDKEGYIWQGNISPKQLRRNDVKFVLGIESYNTKDNEVNWQLKAVQNKSVVSRTPFTNPRITFFEANIIDDAGIEDIEKVIRIYSSGEACGIPSTEHYFAWDGKNIYYIDNTFSVGDADAYGYSESLVFPKAYNSYYSKIILKLISEYTNSEYEENNTETSETKYKTLIYIWDGKKLVLQNQNWDDIADRYK